MEVKYRVTCPDCGAQSQDYEREGDAKLVLAKHDCSRVCQHCEFRVIGRARGLCRQCWKDPEIRSLYFAEPYDPVEEAEFLFEQGCSLLETAERLGVKARSLHRTLTRRGKSDLYWALAKREPDYETRRANSRIKEVA